jgi:hydroxymethylpyrimidine/phosphomethylpyrimidine kinase
MAPAPPIVLSIAGFDPSCGAGITADIKTIAALGCYGITAITALTVQCTVRVRQVVPINPKLLTDSLDELASNVKVSAVHIGMLGTGAIVSTVVRFLRNANPPNVVLDPILVSSSGSRLLDARGIELLTRELMPLANVITPNIDEAAALTGLEVKNPGQMAVAAERFHEMGAKAVVITGGHLDPNVDVLSVSGDPIREFHGEHLRSRNTHGTGCAFSTALACYLALGQKLPKAVASAKTYVTEAIRSSYRIGKGRGPVNHMHSQQEFRGRK